MIYRRVIHFLLLTVLSALSAYSSEIDAAIERASAYCDTDPDSAVILSEQILKKYSLTMPQKIAVVRNVGSAHFQLGDTEAAVRSFSEAVALCRTTDDHLLLADVLSDLGVAYRVSEKADSAMICYNEALALMDKYKAPASDEAMLLTTMATCYANLRRHVDAVPLARKAIAKANESGDVDAIMYSGSQGAIILYNSGFKDEGMTAARRTLSFAEREKSPVYLLKAYLSMLNMHYLDGRRDSVVKYYNKGREVVDQVPSGSLEAMSFLEGGSMVLSMMGRHKESLDAQLKLLSMGNSGSIPLENLWLNIARNYRALGDDDRMADAYEKSISVADSVRRSEIDAQLSEFNVRYDTMQKELEISRLESEKARGRMIGIAVGAAALLLIGALVCYIIVRRRREAEQKLRANIQGIEQERERLARDLHDGICNDLYGISLLMQSGAASTAEMTAEIQRVRSEVRHISHELMPPRFRDTNLDGLLQAYAITSDGFLSYSSEGDCGLSNDISYQLYRIVQETVGNIRSHTDAQSARIVAEYSAAGAVITIRYAGQPVAHAANSTGGIGLTTIERRCELIHASIMTLKVNDESTITIKI